MNDLKRVKVVAAIIHRDGKILVTQRAAGEFKDGWEFPGGKVELGESLEDALVRELKEELNITVSPTRIFHTVEYDYPSFHLSMTCFWCTIKEGHIKLNVHEGLKWLKQSELAALEWLPADVEVVNKLISSSSF